MNHLGDSEREIIATQSAGAVLDLARDLDRPDERFLNSTLLLRLISQQDVDVTVSLLLYDPASSPMSPLVRRSASLLRARRADPPTSSAS